MTSTAAIRASEGKSDSDKETALANYNKVVAASELSDIKLMETKFSVEMEFYAVRDEEKTGKRLLTKRSFNNSITNPIYSSDIGILAGKFNWDVTVRKGRKRLLTLNATYLIVYHKVPEVPQDAAFAFLTRVGRFATYPYFRALVASLTSYARADLPILPVLK